MLNQHYTTAANKITVTTNNYGERVVSASAAIYIRFREILASDRNNGMEVTGCDAMAWAKPDSGLVNGDIIQVRDVYYKISRATQARRLGSETVQFIKCELNVYKELS